MATSLLATSTSGANDSQGNTSQVVIGSNLNLLAGTLSAVLPAGPLMYSNQTVPGGNTIGNSALLTSFSSGFTIGANSLAAGNVIVVNMSGLYGTAVIAPTLTMTLTVGGTTVITTGLLTQVAALTGQSWRARIELLVQTIGSSGSIDVQGRFEFATAATTALTALIGNASAFTVNTTNSLAVAATVQWGVGAVASTITLRQMFAEWLRP